MTFCYKEKPISVHKAIQTSIQKAQKLANGQIQKAIICKNTISQCALQDFKKVLTYGPLPVTAPHNLGANTPHWPCL